MEVGLTWESALSVLLACLSDHQSTTRPVGGCSVVHISTHTNRSSMLSAELALLTSANKLLKLAKASKAQALKRGFMYIANSMTNFMTCSMFPDYISDGYNLYEYRDHTVRLSSTSLIIVTSISKVCLQTSRSLTSVKVLH